MPGDPQFYGPLGYSGFWLFLGLALAVAALGWVAYSIWSTRLPQPGRDVPVPRFHAPAGLRREYLAQIDEVAVLLDAGEITPRTATQELSRIVRGFVQEATGVRASKMTLDELRAERVPVVAEAIEHFYPAEFSVAGARGTDADAALSAARTVVGTWT